MNNYTDIKVPFSEKIVNRVEQFFLKIEVAPKLQFLGQARLP
jgi:hypothetical protein